METRLFILLTLVGILLLPWNMAAQGGVQAKWFGTWDGRVLYGFQGARGYVEDNRK